MPYDEELANRVRKALSGHEVEEKNMFGGLCFMVNGKMCITVGKDRIMSRIFRLCMKLLCLEMVSKQWS